MTITIQVESASQLEAELKGLGYVRVSLAKLNMDEEQTPIQGAPIKAPETEPERPATRGRGRPPKNAQQPAPEAKAEESAEPAAVETAAVEVSAEDQAQDAADEAAETEAAREGDKPTIDDLRLAMGDYATKFGVPAATEDRAKIFSAALGEPPAGEPIWKFSHLQSEGDGEKIGSAVAAWREALAKNPFKREAIG